MSERLRRLQTEERVITTAQFGDEDLGPLKDLPGQWESRGRGWNMIALPFAQTQPGALDYRLLLNQYDETLNFTLVDKGVPNRGVDDTHTHQTDQRVVTLDYEQVIHQVAVIDRPESDVAGAPGSPIHHEPGLFLNMVNLIEDGIDIARLATIPHGDAALALGTSTEVAGVVPAPAVNGLPIGVPQALDNPYLEPYQHFHDTPFFGTVPPGTPGFPGFDPVEPHHLLDFVNQGVSVRTTTVLDLDTTTASGGINNIPFVVAQANPSAMKSTFWIQELEPEPGADPTFRLQYLQIVLLDFFPRRDGLPGRIGWPHVSINTLDRVQGTPVETDQ
jgi:hypothetical protein